MSKFTDMLNKAKREGDAKLKIIAPKYNPRTGRTSSGGSSGRASSGGSGSSKPSEAFSFKEEAEKVSQAKKEAEAKAKIEDAEATRVAAEQAAAQRESSRIQAAKSDIVSSKGMVQTKMVRDKNTGEYTTVTTTSNKSGKVVEVFNPNVKGGMSVKGLGTEGTTTSTYYEKGNDGYIPKSKISSRKEFIQTPVEGPPKDIIKTDYFKSPVPDRTGQVYDSNSKMFVTAPYKWGAGGTAIFSQPTLGEAQAIESAQQVGSARGIVNYGASKYNLAFDKIRAIPVVKKIRGNIKGKGWLDKVDSFSLPPPKQTSQKDFMSTFTTPSGVRSVFDASSEYTLRAGELTEKSFIKTGLIKNDSILTSPGPFSRKVVKDVLSDVYMFSLFAPAIKTGTTSQQLESKYAGEVVEVVENGQYVKMTLAEARAKGLIGRTQAATEFGAMPESRQLDVLKQAFKGRVYLDPSSQAQDILKTSTFLKEAGLSNQKAAKLLLNIFPKQSKASTVLIQESKGIVLPKAGTLGQLEQLPKVLTSTTTTTNLFQPSLVGETTWSNSNVFSIPTTKVTLNQKLLQDTRQNTRQNTRQATKPIQDFIQNTRQDARQNVRQAQVPALDVLQTTKVNQLFDTKFDTKLESTGKIEPLSKLTGKSTGFGNKIFEEVIPRKPKLPRLGFPSLRLPPAFGTRQGYLPQAKTKGGKWITLSKQPMTRSSALSRASRASDATLSAQFRIRKTSGNPTSGGDNYFEITKKKYRPYKIKKGKAVKLHDQFIEKRGSRIDTGGEKKGLKLAKFVKQQGWLVDKKKKKSKSPWLI